MNSIRKYFIPILITMLVFFIAGCSGAGSDAADAIDDSIQEGSPSLIDDLFGGPSDPVEDDDIDGEVSSDDGADAKTNDTDVIALLSLNTAYSKKFDDATHGVEYDCDTTMKAIGGVGEYSWVVTGLPNGMGFNSETRRLKGVPVGLGEFEVLFTVTDEDGNSAERKKDLTVKDDFTIELRYNDEVISGSSDSDDDPITFNEGGVGVAIVNGHASKYTWTILIDGNEVLPTVYEDTQSIYVQLPIIDSENGQNFDLEIAVVDEYENEGSMTRTLVREADAISELELIIAPQSPEESELRRMNLAVSGGKAPYTWDVRVNFHGELFDYIESDSSKLAEVLVVENTDGVGDSELIENNKTADLKGDLFSVSQKEVDKENYVVAVHRIPRVPGVKGYRIWVDVTVRDSLGKERKELFSIKKKVLADTLGDLKMVCDFEDIDDAQHGNAYLKFIFYHDELADGVAEVHYKLKPCDGNEAACEDERKVEPLEDDDGEKHDLSEIALNEISYISIVKHKKTAHTWGYARKVDMDLQWCRFYTDNWFAVWDDQKHGDKLNNDEAGGRKGKHEDMSIHKSFIHGMLEGFERGSIWFMNDMLESVSFGSEDGFDYMKPQDNDGKD
jgi:putative Ig domain-containing protein